MTFSGESFIANFESDETWLNEQGGEFGSKVGQTLIALAVLAITF